jgi:hypothetical protein
MDDTAPCMKRGPALGYLSVKSGSELCKIRLENAPTRLLQVGTKIEPRRATAFSCTTLIEPWLLPLASHKNPYIHKTRAKRVGGKNLAPLVIHGSHENGCTMALLTSNTLHRPSCHKSHRLQVDQKRQTAGSLHSLRSAKRCTFTDCFHETLGGKGERDATRTCPDVTTVYTQSDSR